MEKRRVLLPRLLLGSLAIVVLGVLFLVYFLVSRSAKPAVSDPKDASEASAIDGIGINSADGLSKQEVEKLQDGLERVEKCSTELSGICANTADMDAFISCLKTNRETISPGCREALTQAERDGLI